jgi:uncharacterized protein YcbX
MAIIKDLFFYPIKSFRGLRTVELPIDKQGPRLDRQWMLVDRENKFISQRTMPHLAKIGLRMMDDLEIELSRQDLGTCEFAVEEREGDEFPVQIWKDTVPAFEVSSEVSAWLSEATAQKVRLVRMSDNAKRAFSEKFPDQTVRFTDGKPLLVVSAASMKGLEDRMKSAVSVSRFRPNIVVDQVLPHAEDNWSGFKVGSLEFQSVGPCSRCKITTVHPLTGEMGEEPLKTLGTYRKQEKGIYFGQYYANMGTGRLKVGDQLQLI